MGEHSIGKQCLARRRVDAYGAEQEETDPYGADAYHSGDYAEQLPQEHAHDGSAAEGYALTHGVRRTKVTIS